MSRSAETGSATCSHSRVSCRGAARAGACAAALLLSACAGIEPRGGAPAVPPPPSASPRSPAAGSENSPGHESIIGLYEGEYKYPSAEAYLNGVLRELAEAGERPSEPYKVTILNSPAINAFALPPGNLYLTRGLLALANDGSEVAAVMAHEIGHITARHALQREEEEKRAAVISQAAGVIQSKQKSDEVAAEAKRTIASFSRSQELEADQIGIRVAAKAGYDPFGAARFLTLLGRSAALRSALMGPYANAGKPDILATHPSTPDRIAQAINAARQIGAPGIGKTGRAAYLSAIDGMMFGDDPAEGAVRGREFLHTRLGFAFLAPEGFSLENTAQAVLGISNGGSEALRLDSVQTAPSTALTAYIGSGWIDGLIDSSVATMQINGMEAAAADASAGEWKFRVAVIRFDEDRIYRLIYAARVATPEVKERFQSSIASFHRLTPEEIAAARPLRIAIVAARPGETAEMLAARMAVPVRPLDYFLLLNGLSRGDPLQASEGYKIVAE